MSKFKIGDRVQVRGWEDMKKEFGKLGGDLNVPRCFSRQMRHLCLRTATIRDNNPRGLNLIDWSDNGGDTYFNFSEEMFRLAPKRKKKIERLWGIQEWTTIPSAARITYTTRPF